MGKIIEDIISIYNILGFVLLWQTTPPVLLSIRPSRRPSRHPSIHPSSSSRKKKMMEESTPIKKLVSVSWCSYSWLAGAHVILYIKAKMVSVRPSVCPCGQKLGSAWKILPVTARSLWGQFVLAMGKKIPMDQSGAHSSDTPIRLYS